MKYSIALDIKTVCSLLNLSYSELSNELGVARSTIGRIVKEETYPSDIVLEEFYSFAYKNRIRNVDLNKLKVKYAFENNKQILFHGSKNGIDGEVSLTHSRDDIDIGVGFYLGETYEQASSYVYANRRSSVYIFNAEKLSGLKTKEFSVSLDWMLMVSYFRGQLSEYENSDYIKKLIKDIARYDVIIAPIADNNMYDIMNRFARGDITDLQAISSLSASDLGKQHVLKTLKACQQIKFVDKLYLSKPEREKIETASKKAVLSSISKSKKAIQEYRRKGKYIEEILK